ncbi:MAG TPA: DMT family transporter [Firmicutes bacterium]|nr:DMT family transporter [Bacillota bacterium]
MKSSSLWTNKCFVAFMAVVACILWGSAFPILKLTYAELQLTPTDVYSRLLLAGGRFLLASVMIFILFGAFRQPMGIRREWVFPLFLLGLAQTGLQYFFFYNGVAHATGIKSAILNSVGNFLVVVLAPLFYPDDRLHLGKVIGLVAGFAGIVLVNWQPQGTGFDWQFSLVGEGFLMFAGITSVIGTFYAKRLSRKIHPVVMNGYQLLFGSLLLLISGVPALLKGSLRTTPLFWGLFLYSAFLSAAAFSIWYTLLKYNRAAEVTMYRFTIPVAGAILSAALLPTERLTLSVGVSLLLVALGIVVVNRWRPSDEGELVRGGEAG